MNIGRLQLVREVSEITEIPQYWVKVVIECFLWALRIHLARGDRITFRKFGTFTSREMPAHRGRNIGTGEELEIPSRRFAHFKSSPSLRCLLNCGESWAAVTHYDSNGEVEDVYDPFEEMTCTTSE